MKLKGGYSKKGLNSHCVLGCIASSYDKFPTLILVTFPRDFTGNICEARLTMCKNWKVCHVVIRNNIFYLPICRYNILAYSEQDCIWQCTEPVWNVSTSLQYRDWGMIKISHKIIYLYCTDWRKLCPFYLGQFNQMSLNMLGRIK